MIYNPKTTSTIKTFGLQMILLLLLAVYIFFPISVKAQSINNDHQWVQFIDSSYNFRNKPENEKKFALLVGKDAVRLSGLNKVGFTVLRRVSDRSVIGAYNKKDFNKINNNITYNFYYVNNKWKLSEDLLKNYSSKKEIFGEYWLTADNKIHFTNFINEHSGSKILYQKNNYFLVSFNRIKLEEIIKQPFVIYIANESNNVKGEATVLDLNLNPNRINAAHHFFSDILGQQQTLSIKEPLYNIYDIDLSGRFIESGLESEYKDSHTTQMATIAVGAGNSFVTGKGVAPLAYHTSSDNSMVLPDKVSDYERLNIQIQNHSYGTQIESFYGVMAAMFDESTMDKPDLLHVFSSGNSGDKAATEGKYSGVPGFANLTGNYKQAKNILTVGSVDTTHTPINLSSKGPAYDGRVKPELVTYSMAGTSNSAALVSGTAILLQQKYKELHNEAMPAALLKSFLINSADDIHFKGVDYSTGYGSLNALRALENVQNSRFFIGTINAEEVKSFSLDIPDNALNLKITLVWSDPAANPNDAKALINDLDLKVNSAEAVYLPMILNPEENLDAINSPATNGEDHLNNIEQVVIDFPAAGNYNIKVGAFDVPVSNQDFYIAYQWDIKDSFRWTSPTAADNIPYNGETVSHLRWKSSFGDEKGELSYQLIVGENSSEWFPVDMDITLEEEQYRWKSPDTHNLALLKMNIQGKEFISDTFSIGPDLRLGVGFNCADSIKLQWENIPEATSYEIKSLIENKLQTVLYTSDTSVVVASEEIKSNFFQITPFIGDKPLLQSFTINYQLQGAGCFISTFFVETIQDSGVFLHLQLGALNGINQITFEKLGEDNEWSEITAKSPDQLQFKILDDQAEDGFNSYRVSLEFDNQTILHSDTLTTYYVKSRDFIVYPNPLSKDEALKIFSKKLEGDYVFRLINKIGEIIYQSSFSESRTFIELPPLADGLYVYHIYQNGQTATKGKLVIFN